MMTVLVMDMLAVFTHLQLRFDEFSIEKHFAAFILLSQNKTGIKKFQVFYRFNTFEGFIYEFSEMIQKICLILIICTIVKSFKKCCNFKSFTCGINKVTQKYYIVIVFRFQVQMKMERLRHIVKCALQL